MTDHREFAESSEPTLSHEPMDSAEAAEPAEPIDRKLPTEPTDSTEPTEPMDSADPTEATDRTESPDGSLHPCESTVAGEDDEESLRLLIR